MLWTPRSLPLRPTDEEVRRLGDLSGAYIVPPTKVAGDLLTTTLWNTYVRDNLDSGVVRPIADTTLGASAANVDFLSIPQTFAHLFVEVYPRGDTAAVDTSVIARLNADSTGTYIWERIAATATGIAASEGIGDTSLQLGKMPANTATANMFGGITAKFYNYANATNKKTFTSHAADVYGTATGLAAILLCAGLWNTTAAINRITISPAAGNFVAGTRVTLYGMGYI